jgi:hypothetical protein
LEKEDENGRGGAPPPAPLPVDRAFVVQLRAATLAGDEPFAGRAEHIASGTAARFASAESLIEFIREVLAAEGSVGMPHGEAGEAEKKRR